MVTSPPQSPTWRDALLSARKRLLEHGWSRDECPAIDAEGKRVRFNHPDAVAWSLLGAFNVGPEPDKIKYQAMGRCRVFLPKRVTLVDFNRNCESVEEVVDLIDEALG